MITFCIRWFRIFKHLIQFIYFGDSRYWYEIEHYFYTKKFKTIQ